MVFQIEYFEKVKFLKSADDNKIMKKLQAVKELIKKLDSFKYSRNY